MHINSNPEKAHINTHLRLFTGVTKYLYPPLLSIDVESGLPICTQKRISGLIQFPSEDYLVKITTNVLPKCLWLRKSVVRDYKTSSLKNYIPTFASQFITLHNFFSLKKSTLLFFSLLNDLNNMCLSYFRPTFFSGYNFIKKHFSLKNTRLVPRWPMVRYKSNIPSWNIELI